MIISKSDQINYLAKGDSILIKLSNYIHLGQRLKPSLILTKQQQYKLNQL